MYFDDPTHKMYQYSLRMAPRGLKYVGMYIVNKVVLTCIVHVGYLHNIVLSLHGYGQDKDL